MISVGYLAKRIAPRPDWLNAPEVKDIYSVSNCISADFMDYIKFWRHNGYWLFDSPRIIQELALQHNLSLEHLTFFYYEAYEQEFNEESRQWLSFKPKVFPTDVIPLTQRSFQGYDVVTFGGSTSPGCSPLSCNGLASKIKTNSHCLLDSFDDAKNRLEAGQFDQSEPGPFRIFAVYKIDVNNGLD
jgi:hypothetical protein